MRWRVKLQPATIGHGIAVALLVMLPLFYHGKAYAAGAFVQQSPVSIATNNSNSQAARQAQPQTSRAGNLLVIVCSVGASATVSVAGFSTAAASVSGTVSQGIFYKIAAGGETSITCDSSVRTKNGVGAHLYEYSGINTLSTLDTSGTAGGTGTAVNSGSATPTSTSSLIFTAFTSNAGTAYSGLTAGYTKRADTMNKIHPAQADLFTTSNTAQVASATNSASGAWRGQIAVFKVAVGSKWADIVDGSNNSVASPTISFPTTITDLACDTNGASLRDSYTENTGVKHNSFTHLVDNHSRDRREYGLLGWGECAAAV